MAFSSLRQWWKRLSRSSRRRPSSRNRKLFPKLELENLEVRLTPATDTWTGLGGTNLNWSNSANWSTTNASGIPMPGDDLVFPTLAPAQSSAHVNNNDLTNPDGTPLTLNSITISDSKYILNGNSVTLGLGTGALGSGNIIVGNGAIQDVINFAVQMGGNTTNNQTVQVLFGSDLTVNGNLSGSGVTLTKLGTGSLFLAGDNGSFNGSVTVAQGILGMENHNTALGAVGGTTTVQTNAQLQVISVTGQIQENLTVQGPGINNDGAILVVSGSAAGENTFVDPVTLDGDTILGADATAVMTFSGQISDLGAGHNLTKAGPGTVIFTTTNTYRGTTTINNGILLIEDPMALGNTPTNAQVNGGPLQTIVNTGPSGSGTLQLNPLNGVGMTIDNETLTLNGPGVTQGLNQIGALDNKGGNNTWTGNVILGSNFPNGQPVLIGSEANGPNVTNLTIAGVVMDRDLTQPGNTSLPLGKVGPGRLTFTNSNTYLGTTDVYAGILNIEDSQALGPTGKLAMTTVHNNAALEMTVDNIPDSIVSGSTTQLDVTAPLTIFGMGAMFNGKLTSPGALHSVSGINTWAGPIFLGHFTTPLTDAIGVDPDISLPLPGGNDVRPNHPATDNSYYTNDFSLTITGLIQDTGFVAGDVYPVVAKVDNGQLILPNANTYTDANDIQQGWVTIENNNALGSRLNAAVTLTVAPPLNQYVFGGITLGDTVQPPTFVENGAAVHLKALTGTLSIADNFVLQGTGVNVPGLFNLINNRGALMNLDGFNTVTGDIKLFGSAGIGVEQVDLAPPIQSELTLTGSLSDYVPPAPASPQPGGVIKFGSQRLYMQGDGTYTGATDIKQGVIRDQNSAAFGATNAPVIVESGAALELQHGNPLFNGGITAGIEVVDKPLILNGGGNTSAIPIPGSTSAIPIVGGSAPIIAPLTNVSDDNVWTGPISLNTYSLDYTVTFPTSKTNLNFPTMSADATNLAGANTSISVATTTPGNFGTNEVQTLTFAGVITSGTFTLTFTDQNSVSATTGPITWDTNTTNLAANIQNALAHLANIATFAPQVVGIDPTIDTEPNSRLSLQGPIDDKPNTSLLGSDVNKVGAGELDLSNPTYTPLNPPNTNYTAGLASSYRGTTTIQQGVVVVASSQALGAVPQATSVTVLGAQVGGTVVASGATLETEGNITIAGEPLTLAGQGVATVPTVPLTWFQQGPAPIANGFTNAGIYHPVGNLQETTGRVTGVAVDPSDPNVIYITTADGGAWKTKNSGASWTPLFDSQLGSTIFAGAVAIAPWDPRVIFIGTGEADNSPDSFYGTGVYMSSDSGKTWTQLVDPSNPINGLAVSSMVVDPGNLTGQGSLANFNLYVATSNQNITNGFGATPGVYRFNPITGWFNLTKFPSFNRVNTGSVRSNPIPKTPGPDDNYLISFPQISADWSSLTLDKNNALFVALGNPAGSPNNGVYRTYTPNSATASSPPVWWMGDGDQPGVNGPDGGGGNGVFPQEITAGGLRDGHIKITSVNPAVPIGPNSIISNTTVYAVVTDWFNNQELQIYTSTNGGGSWAADAVQPDGVIQGFTPTGQGNYDSIIQAVVPGTYYVAGQLDAELHNGSVNFINPEMGGISGNGPHQAFHAMALDSQNRLVVGTDGGVWRYDPVAGLWSDLNGNLDNVNGTNLPLNLAGGNLAITQFNSVSVATSTPALALGGAQSNGVDQSSGNPVWTQTLSGDGGPVVIDPKNPTIAYAIQHNLPNYINPISDISFLMKGIAPSVGAPYVWSNVATLNPPTGGIDFGPSPLFFQYPLVVDSINDNRILVGGPTGIQESSDGTATWHNLGTGTVPLPGGASANVTSIGIATYQGTVADSLTKPGFIADPGFSQVQDHLTNSYDPDTIYVVLNRTQVWVTKNHGVSWVNITGTLPGNIQSITVDPRNRDTIYVVRNVFGGHQVWTMTDTDSTKPTWTDISKGLPDSPVWSIALDPRSGTVYIGNDLGVYAYNGTSFSRFGTGLPLVSVHALVLNQAQNTLTAGSYGRSMFTLTLDTTQVNGGALAAISGSPVWTGPVSLVNDGSGSVYVGAYGTQILQTGISYAQLNVVGAIGDAGMSVLPSPLGASESGSTVTITTALPHGFAVGQSVTMEGVGLAGYNGVFTITGVPTPTTFTYTDPTTGLVNSGGGTAVINAPPTLVKIGSGNVTLSGNNIYGGNTEVREGVLIANNQNALGLPGISEVQTITLSGNLSGTFKVNFEGAATGNLSASIPASGGVGPLASLQNALNALATIGGVGGNVTVTQNTVGATSVYTIIFGGTLVGVNLPAVTVAPSPGTNAQVAIPTVGFGGTVVDQRLPLGANGGGAGAALELQSSVANEPLTLNGDGFAFNGHNTGALRNISGFNIYSGPVFLSTLNTIPVNSVSPNTGDTIGVDSGSQLTISNVISDGSQTLNLTKEGSGTLILSGANGYKGTTFVNTGALQAANNLALGTPGAPPSNGTQVMDGAELQLSAASEVQQITVTGSAGIFVLTFNNASTPGTVAQGALLFNATAAQVAAALNALPTIGGAGGAVTVTLSGNTFTITFGGTLAGTKQNLITGVGSGGTTVSAATEVTAGGPITITNETLSLSGSGISNHGALENVTGSNTWSGQVVLTSNPAFAPPTTPSGTVFIGVDTFGDALTVGGPNGTISELANSGVTSFGLTKVGLGKLVLANADSYSGITTIGLPGNPLGGGILDVQNTGALGTAGGPTSNPPNGTVVNANSTLMLDTNPLGSNNAPQTFSNEILTLNGTGVNGIGALDNVSGNNTWAATQTPPASINLASSSAIGVDGGKLTVTGDISGASPYFNLSKVGVGSLFLPTPNDYQGLTLIQNGIVNVTNTAALGAPNTSEVQNVTVTGSAGTFNLTFNTFGGLPATTTALPWDASAAQVASALNALPTIGSINGGDIGGSVGVALGGVSEVEQVTVSGSSGIFWLTYTNPFTNVTSTTPQTVATGALPWNATAKQVMDALNLLPSISGGNPIVGPGAGSVTVTQSGNVYSITFGGTLGVFKQNLITGNASGGASVTSPAFEKTAGNAIYTVTFQGNLAGFAQNLITGTPLSGNVGIPGNVAAEVTKGTGGTVVTSTNETQVLTVNGTAGNFWLTFNGGSTPTSGKNELAFNATAGQIQTALNAVLATTNPGATASVQQSGSSFTITFAGTLAGQYLPQIVPHADPLNPGVTASVSVSQFGGSGTLQVQNNLTYSADTLMLNGAGFGGMGALDSPKGNNTWAGPLVVNGTASVSADTDSTNTQSTLTLSQGIGEAVLGAAPGFIEAAAPGSGLTKLGTGIVAMTGTASNVYTGTTAVSDGILQLNKTGAVAVSGNLVVGDDTTTASLDDVAVLLQSNQLAATSKVTVNSDGFFDLGNFTQTIAGLTMHGGEVSLTGPASQLTLTGPVTASSAGATDPALITDGSVGGSGGSGGSLFLSGPGAILFTVSGTNPPDLIIDAPITGTAGLTKKGTGTLQLTNLESYSGITTVSAGNLEDDGTIGAVSLAGGTLSGSSNGSGQGITGAITSVAAPAVAGVVNPGDLGAPGVLTANGNVTWSNQTTYNVQLTSAADALVVNGNVAINGATLTGTIVGITPNIGDAFTIMEVAAGKTISGLFSNLDAKGLSAVFLNGMKFLISIIEPTASLTGSVVLTRIPMNTTTVVSAATPASPVQFGTQVTFTATVNTEVPAADPLTGSVTFFDGATSLGDGTLVTATGVTPALYTFTTDQLQLAVGTHTITAVYGNDALFNTSTSPNFTFKVVKAVSSIVVGAPTPPSPSPYGTPVTFTFTVLPTVTGSTATVEPTGTLTFKDGLKTLTETATPSDPSNSGFATAVLNPALSEFLGGTHNLTATYSGDANFAASTTSFSYVVSPAPTSAAVTSTPAGPVNFGTAVTFTATITPSVSGSPVPTGRVTFFDGVKSLGGSVNLSAAGTAAFTTTANQLLGGTHSITAVYTGDANFATTTSPVYSFQVNAVPTSTSLVVSPATQTTFGSPITLTATVSHSGATAPTGTVTFFDGTTSLGSPNLPASGTVTFTTTATQLGGGSHSLTAFYSGDTKYDNSTSTAVNYTVNPAATATTLTVTPASPQTFGTPVTFTATITGTTGGVLPTGTVTFMDGTATLASGIAVGGTAPIIATYTPTNSQFIGGTHSVTAVYSGDANYATSTSAAKSYTINALATTTSIASTPASSATFGTSVTFTATINTGGVSSPAPGGTVTFLDGAATLASGVTVTSSQAVYSTSTLPGGAHSIKAVYSGDGTFATSTSSAESFTVNPIASSTALTVSPGNASVFGTLVTLTAAVTSALGSPNPTGTVTFLDGSTTLAGGVTVSSGVALYTTAAGQLTGGSHSLTAVYSGDSNFQTSTSSPAVSYTVSPTSSTTTLSSTPMPPTHGNFGTPVTFTATITPAVGSVLPTGTVTFMDGLATLASGVTVNKFGSSAEAIYTTTQTQLAIGTHTITAQYSGDNSYNGSTSTGETLTIDRPASNVTPSSSPNPSNLGVAVTFTATVSPAFGSTPPTGSVTFVDGSNTLGVVNTSTPSGSNSIWTYTTTAGQLPGGANSISMVYSGDVNYVGSTGTMTQTVNKGSSTTTLSSITPASPTYGHDQVTLTAQVTGSVGAFTPLANTTVTFKDGSTVLGTGAINGGGVATYTTTSTQLGGGTHNNITAVWAGDADYNGSTSTAASLTVNQAADVVTVSSNSASAPYGQVTITVSVTPTAGNAGTPGGSVTFKINNSTVETDNLGANGTVTLSLSNTLKDLQASGTAYSITATYSGDANFLGNTTSNTLSQTITQATTSTLVGSSSAGNTSVFGQTVTFTAQVSPAGAGVPTGSVTFLDNNVSIGSGTLVQAGVSPAVYTFKTSTLSVAAHNISATYSGDSNFQGSSGVLPVQTVNPAQTTTTVSSSAPTAVYGQNPPVTFTATVKVSGAGAGTPVGQVSFYDGDPNSGGVFLGSGNLTATTQGQQASYTLTPSTQLGGGAHTIFARYVDNLDSNFAGSTGSTPEQVNTAGSTTVFITPANNSVTVVGKVVSYTVTVTSAGLGGPTGSVTFSATENGSPVAISSPTQPLSGGQAGVTIQFTTPGSIIVTAHYNGDANFGSSSATVAQTALTANQAFVNALYVDFLGRQADPAGLAAWTSAVDNNLFNPNPLFNRDFIAYYFQNSTEYREDEVDALYVHYLRRHADPTGLASFTNYLQAGGTIESVASLLIGSAEYFNNTGNYYPPSSGRGVAGGTVDGWIRAMYLDALGRPVDPQGEQAFTQALAFNVTRTACASILLGSTEYKEDVVTAAYQRFLGHAPDPNGLAGWTYGLQHGFTDEQLYAGIISSQEFYNNL